MLLLCRQGSTGEARKTCFQPPKAENDFIACGPGRCQRQASGRSRTKSRRTSLLPPPKIPISTGTIN